MKHRLLNEFANNFVGECSTIGWQFIRYDFGWSEAL
jgi:hypothetical protein